MDGAELFGKCLAQTTIIVKQVRPEHYANATPCTDWHVWDLIDHLLTELQAVPKLLAGKSIQPGDDDSDGSDLVVESEVNLDLSLNWQVIADASENASLEADLEELAHPDYGDVSNDIYLYQVATDLLVHAWDLAAAIGMTVVFEPDTVLAAYNYALSPEGSKQSDDSALEPLGVDDNAPLQIKLLSQYGRSLDWRAA